MTATAAAIKLPTPAPAKARLLVARPRLPSAEAVLPYLKRIDEARWYSNFGPLVREFEARLAARFGEEAHVVTAVNATQALTLTLKALDLPAGSLCALPAWTFVATAHAVVQAGLVPWFLDVDPETAMLDPAAVREALARAPGPVSAAIPVCAHGAMVDLDAWRGLRDETGVAVVVDAAAAFDQATAADLPIVVSLHATKVLGVGEGGFLATTDKPLALRVRQMTQYGFLGTREAQFLATNAKLSEYAAAVGLAALDAWPGDRLRFCFAAQRLRIALALAPAIKFQPGWGSEWATSVCVVRTPDEGAEAAVAALAEDGIETRRWWGDGCHASRAFAGFPRMPLPATERLARASVGLPFAIDLGADDVQRIAAALTHAFG
jgi:dTDP-4-amino-4,6-dideoxygalactose transaminase